jgi:hypothetical protein
MGLNTSKVLNNFNILADCLEVLRKNAYICTVKTLKGHEAAAPKKAAYFVPRCKRNNVVTAWASGNTPKGTSLRGLDSA